SSSFEQAYANVAGADAASYPLRASQSNRRRRSAAGKVDTGFPKRSATRQRAEGVPLRPEHPQRDGVYSQARAGSFHARRIAEGK
ncbi:hypothetical protein ABTF84_19925, partial [Acinetobacter baumannii]